MPIEKTEYLWLTRWPLANWNELAEEEGPNEVRLLANGINHAGESPSEQANARMEREITRATAQLHATLD